MVKRHNTLRSSRVTSHVFSFSQGACSTSDDYGFQNKRKATYGYSVLGICCCSPLKTKHTLCKSFRDVFMSQTNVYISYKCFSDGRKTTDDARTRRPNVVDDQRASVKAGVQEAADNQGTAKMAADISRRFRKHTVASWWCSRRHGTTDDLVYFGQDSWISTLLRWPLCSSRRWGKIWQSPTRDITSLLDNVQV